MGSSGPRGIAHACRACRRNKVGGSQQRGPLRFCKAVWRGVQSRLPGQRAERVSEGSRVCSTKRRANIQPHKQKNYTRRGNQEQEKCTCAYYSPLPMMLRAKSPRRHCNYCDLRGQQMCNADNNRRCRSRATKPFSFQTNQCEMNHLDSNTCVRSAQSWPQLSCGHIRLWCRNGQVFFAYGHGHLILDQPIMTDTFNQLYVMHTHERTKMYTLT